MAGKITQPEAPEQLGEQNAEAAPRVAVDYSAGQAKIAEIVKFHATPVATQALREAFGWLGREAAAASRKRPRNRPAELAGWPLPALRLLAELCEAYAPETGTVDAPREPEMFPDAAAAPVVVSERMPLGTRTETLTTVLDAPAEVVSETLAIIDGTKRTDSFYPPDPWIEPEPVVAYMMPAPTGVPWNGTDPFVFYPPDPDTWEPLSDDASTTLRELTAGK